MVTGKDIILEVLRKLTVKGGVNKIFEYGGEGVKTLIGATKSNNYKYGSRAWSNNIYFPK